MAESVGNSGTIGDPGSDDREIAEGRADPPPDGAAPDDQAPDGIVPDGVEPDVDEPDGDERDGSPPVADSDAAADEPSRGVTHRVRSALGVAVVGITGAFIVIYALPDAPITRHVPKWVYNTGDVITLNQNWALFAPDPPSTDVQLDFVITDANGDVTVESLPTGPVWLPTARSERWRKVRERLTPTSAAKRWPEALQWSLAQLKSSGRDPQKIELRRRWIEREADNPDDAGTERQFTFARLVVPTNEYVVLDPDAPGAVKEQPADASADGRVKKTDQ